MQSFHFLKFWFRLSAWKKIMTALVLGALLGILMGPSAVYLKPIGHLFISAIHMVVSPVVFTAIVCAVFSVGDAKQMGRVSWQAAIIYLLSMAAAAAIGLGVALLIKPGASFHPVLESATNKVVQAPTFLQVIENIIPRNPLAALAGEHILQIVLFALVFGFSVRMAGEKARIIQDFFQSLSAVVFKLAGLIIAGAPYGVFALIAWTFGRFGLHAMLPLAQFVFTVYLSCLLQVFLVYVLMLLLLTRLNPLSFFKGIASALAFAFTTSSSAATLPLSMKCAENNLGVSSALARFLLPLGSSFNLNGLSIYLSVAVVFAENVYNIHLTLSQYFTVISTIVLTAMGAAAVPGSALIVMGAVFSSVGIPLGVLVLIAGVDRLNDMVQTATNVAGDLFATTVIADNEDLLKRDH